MGLLIIFAVPQITIVMSSGLSEFSLEDGKCLTESLRYKLEVNRLVSLFVFIIIIHVKNVFSLSFGVTILDAHVH